MKATEIRAMTSEELEKKLKELKNELFNLRFQSATGQLENNGRLRAVKRDIARIYTVLRERELGIRPEAVAPVEEAAPEKKKSKKKAAESEAAVAEDDAK